MGSEHIKSTEALRRATSFPPGRSEPQASTIELLCGLVTESSDLCAGLNNEGVDLNLVFERGMMRPSRDDVPALMGLAARIAIGRGAQTIGIVDVVSALSRSSDTAGARLLAGLGADARSLARIVDAWPEGAESRENAAQATARAAAWSPDLLEALEYVSGSIERVRHSVEFVAGLAATSERFRTLLTEHGVDPSSLLDAALSAAPMSPDDARMMIAATATIRLRAGTGAIDVPDLLDALKAHQESSAARLLASFGVKRSELTYMAEYWTDDRGVRGPAG